MARKALARVPQLVSDSSVHHDDAAPFLFRERELSEEWIFQGTDERGRDGWFVRLEISGLYSRRVGPFVSQEAAEARFEQFLDEVVSGPLCQLGNTLRDNLVCVVEGIPRLAATVSAK